MRKLFRVETDVPPLSSLLIMLSLLLLSIYYTMPIMINLLGSLRHLYLAGSVFMFMLGLFLDRDAKLFFAFVLMELLILLLWKSIWNAQMGFGNYVMPVSVFNIYFTAAHYYLLNERAAEEKLLFYAILAVNTITAVTTILTFRSNPWAVRNSTRTDIAEATKYRWRSLNIGNWNYLYGVVFLVPCLVFLFCCSRHKLLWAAWLAVIMVAILVSELTIALFFALLAIVLIFIGKPENRLQFLILLAGIVFVVAFAAYLDKFVYFLRELTENIGLGTIAKKMDTIYILLTENTATGNASDRMNLYGTSLSTFFDHPLTGMIFVKESPIGRIGFHSEFCDLLGGIGLIGLSSLAFFLYERYAMIKLYIAEEFRWRVGIITAGVFLLAVLNPILYAPQISMNAFLMPTLLVHMLERQTV